MLFMFLLCFHVIYIQQGLGEEMWLLLICKVRLLGKVMLYVCNMIVTLCTVRGVRDQQSHNADPALCTQGKHVEYYVLTVRAENFIECVVASFVYIAGSSTYCTVKSQDDAWFWVKKRLKLQT